MPTIIRIFAIVTTILVFSASAQAQSGKTILVLDASGSMWGQIDGENKIVIAKRAVGELLDSLPADTELGLVAYGHREKGQCSDIETLVAPGTGTREAIRAAVDAINPKGKTPLSDAVLQAAETLKYEEDKATVILLSDGIETCERDPCAVGTALEQAGVDFTAHVIGFDVSADADRAQLACLAENTGGRFLSASNAAELNEALVQVAETPPPPPATADIEFVATLGDNGPTITDGIRWTLTPQAEDGTRLADFEVGELRMAVRLGAYRVTVDRPDTEDSVYRDIIVALDGDKRYVLALPDPTPKAALSAPAQAPVGATILVGWEGPGDDSDRIKTAEPGARSSAQETYAYVKHGNPLAVRVPPLPGDYELSYVSKGKDVLASQPLTATPLTVTLDAPAEALASTTIKVGYDGPDYELDRITVAEIGARGSAAVNYAYTKDGSPVDLVMPVKPGTYEIRYVMALGSTIMASQPIEITEVLATVSAPATGPAGSAITVDWTGPDNKNDRIAIAKVGARGTAFEAYVYTKEGSPTKLILPGISGDYEVRYMITQGNTIAASAPVTVTEPVASVSAPDTASIGASVVVEWTGPDNERDYISVAEIDARGTQYESYSYTDKGSPLSLTMPGKPGTYEIRYILNQGGIVLASRPITVAEVEASVSAPATAQAGSPIVVEWVGPDTKGDYISIAKPDERGARYESYVYTDKGNPLRINAPGIAGEYELRYVLDKNNTVIASQPITVQEAEASVSAPATAEAGAAIVVDWTGPDNQGDYIAIAEPGARGGQYESYVYTDKGSPARINAPGTPGEYELRYILNQGKVVAASASLTVTAAQATITAPGTADGGASIVVEWTGPDNEGDYIAIAEPDARGGQYESYAYTREGSPLRIQVPGKPGDYELRYILNQDKAIAERVALSVVAPTASLEAPTSAAAGSNVVVTWAGPDNDRDYIALSELGTPDREYVDYVYTSEGSPIIVKMPEKPGEYELRYVINADKVVIERSPITVE